MSSIEDDKIQPEITTIDAVSVPNGFQNTNSSLFILIYFSIE